MYLKFMYRTCVSLRRRECVNIHIVNRFHENSNEPVISTIKLKQNLKQRNISFIEGHTCISIDCPTCGCNETKGSRIHINKTTGFFICEKCTNTGPWNVFHKFLETKNNKTTLKELTTTMKSSSTKEENFIHKWEDLKKTSKSVSELSPTNYDELLKKLSLPNVSQEDMSLMNCIYNSTECQIYFPMLAFNSQLVGYKILSDVSEITEPSQNVSGFVIYKHKHSRTETAVVVPTIRDLLALTLQKSINTTICLPYNLNYLPQQSLPSLENYKKLILWFGNDEASWDTARHFAKKLNEKRCYFVRPTDLQPRPKIAVEKNYDTKTIIKNAQPVWHESITTFEHLRADILSDLQNVDKVQGIKWKRYPSLNRILKGHRRGELTILTGPTGCGKTTFISEYSLDLAMQGVNTLWGSFEIRNARLARTMLQQMVGVCLESNIDNFDTYADDFTKLPVYFMTFHGQQSIKVVMEAVEHATYVHDISHVIIDNVQFMMGTLDQSRHLDRFWAQDSIISSFRCFATKYNCHVTLIIHPRKEREDELTTSSIFGSAKATQEADNVLIIQDKRLVSVRGKKYLQVAKNRYSGDLGIMIMDFDKTSLSYAQKKKFKCNEGYDEEQKIIEKQKNIKTDKFDN